MRPYALRTPRSHVVECQDVAGSHRCGLSSLKSLCSLKGEGGSEEGADPSTGDGSVDVDGVTGPESTCKAPCGWCGEQCLLSARKMREVMMPQRSKLHKIEEAGEAPHEGVWGRAGTTHLDRQGHGRVQVQVDVCRSRGARGHVDGSMRLVAGPRALSGERTRHGVGQEVCTARKVAHQAMWSARGEYDIWPGEEVRRWGSRWEAGWGSRW